MWHGFRNAGSGHGTKHLKFHTHEDILAETVSLHQLLRPAISFYLIYIQGISESFGAQLFIGAFVWPLLYDLSISRAF